jgi:hypothetical protein
MKILLVGMENKLSMDMVVEHIALDFVLAVYQDNTHGISFTTHSALLFEQYQDKIVVCVVAVFIKVLTTMKR